MRIITNPDIAKYVKKSYKKCVKWKGYCGFSFDNIHLPCKFCNKKFLIKVKEDSER